MILQALLILYLSVYAVESAPTTPTASFYDHIILKCPSLVDNIKYKSLPLFHTCNNTRIEAQQATTNVDIICLLYYYTFTQYCNNNEHVEFVIDEKKLERSLEIVCKDVVPPQLEPNSSLYKILANVSICKQVCRDLYDLSTSLCSVIYYYKHWKPPVASANRNHLLQVPPKHLETVPQPQSKPASEGGVKSSTTTVLSNDSKIAAQPVGPSNDEYMDAHSINGIKTPLENGVKADAPNTETEKHSPVQAQQNTISNVVKTVQNQSVINNNPQKTLNTAVASSVKPRKGEHPKEISEINDDPRVNESDEEDELVINDNDPQVNVRKPPETDDDPDSVSYAPEMEGDSYFFTYFMLLCIICVVGYVCYHNKQKILALILEGRQGKRQYRGKRPNSANYHKLDSNLEEAITSSCDKNTSNVIY